MEIFPLCWLEVGGRFLGVNESDGTGAAGNAWQPPGSRSPAFWEILAFTWAQMWKCHHIMIMTQCGFFKDVIQFIKPAAASIYHDYFSLYSGPVLYSLDILGFTGTQMWKCLHIQVLNWIQCATDKNIPLHFSYFSSFFLIILFSFSFCASFWRVLYLNSHFRLKLPPEIHQVSVYW